MEKWRELTSDAGDHLTLLNVYRKWTVDGGCGWQWCQDNFVYFQTMKNAKVTASLHDRPQRTDCPRTLNSKSGFVWFNIGVGEGFYRHTSF